MDFTNFMWSWAREADKSALGTVNRPLQAVWYDRRPRFIAGIADLSALAGCSNIRSIL